MHIRIILIVCTFFITSASMASENIREENLTGKIQNKVITTIDVHKDSQAKEDLWAQEKNRLKAQYRSLQKELNFLKKVREREDKKLLARKKSIAEIEDMIEESKKIKEELQSYLESITDQLGDWINRDLPFLPDERSARLASIQETLSKLDASLAEKYRRVMEALQIETEYGRSVEVYQETIDFDNELCLVDILRVGRLSLFFRTPDGKQTGAFDPENLKWIILPSKYNHHINKSIEIATRQRTVDFVKLPIGRIVVP